MVDKKDFPGIEDELEIVWLMDTSKMDYVRQSMDMYCSRKTLSLNMQQVFGGLCHSEARDQNR